MHQPYTNSPTGDDGNPNQRNIHLNNRFNVNTVVPATLNDYETTAQAHAKSRFRSIFYISILLFVTTTIATASIVTKPEYVSSTFLCPNLKVWILVFPVRLLVSGILSFILYKLWMDGVPVHLQTSTVQRVYRLAEFNRIIGLVFFFLANSWLSRTTDDCQSTEIFRLSLGYLILQYIQLLLPLLILGLLLVSVFCCFPLIIRVLNSTGMIIPTQHPATERDISRLTEIHYTPGMTIGSGTTSTTDPTCSICLTEYQSNDTLRVLPCGSSHHFHKSCIDQWLRINANCPVCRRIVIETPGSGPVGSLPPSSGGGGRSGNGNNNADTVGGSNIENNPTTVNTNNNNNNNSNDLSLVTPVTTIVTNSNTNAATMLHGNEQKDDTLTITIPSVPGCTTSSEAVDLHINPTVYTGATSTNNTNSSRSNGTNEDTKIDIWDSHVPLLDSSSNHTSSSSSSVPPNNR